MSVFEESSLNRKRPYTLSKVIPESLERSFQKSTDTNRLFLALLGVYCFFGLAGIVNSRAPSFQDFGYRSARGV